MTTTAPKFNTTTTPNQTPNNPNANSSLRKTTAPPVIEDDDVWIKEFRRKIQTQAAQRKKEARQQAEEEFRTAINRTSDPERAERVRREFEIALWRLEQLFRDEEEDLIQHEKEVRSWSREGGLTVNAEMVREQEMIMQALGMTRDDIGIGGGGGDGQRSANTPTTANRSGSGTQRSSNPTSRWIPPAGTAEKDVPDRGRQRPVGSNHHHPHTTEASRGRRISNSSTSSTPYTQQYSQPTVPPQRIPPPSTKSSFFPDRRPINEEPHSTEDYCQSDSPSNSESEYTLTKSIILDLLGSGVHPEYLVDCGVSRQAVFDVFTELNLKLPESLDVRGLVPYGPTTHTVHHTAPPATTSAPAPVLQQQPPSEVDRRDGYGGMGRTLGGGGAMLPPTVPPPRGGDEYHNQQQRRPSISHPLPAKPTSSPLLGGSHDRPMNGASTFSTASRRTASTSSTSSWASSRSNASSATDYSTRSNTTATPHWQQGSSNTRQSPTSLSASRAPTGDCTNAKPAGWKTGASPGSASAAASAGSSPPLSEAEWRSRQDEQANRQQEQFRRDLMKRKQEQLARSASKVQVQRAWQNYELGWATLKDRPTLHFKTTPWPTLKVPTSLEDLSTSTIGPFLLSPHHSQGKSNRDRIKEQLLRWHPDRFEGKWMTKVARSDKDIVKEAVGQVFRSLNKLNTLISDKSSLLEELEREMTLGDDAVKEIDQEIDNMFEAERQGAEGRQREVEETLQGLRRRAEEITLEEDRDEGKCLERVGRWDVDERLTEEDPFGGRLQHDEKVRQDDEQCTTGETSGEREKVGEQVVGHRDADSITEWQKWWKRANATDVLTALEGCMEFDEEGKLECLKVASSAKIYQHLVGFVYMQMKMHHGKQALLDSFRRELSKWGSWNDHEWLSKHDIIRNSLWSMHQETVSKPISGGDTLRNILNHDLEVISSKLAKILADRQEKTSFLAACCANDPVSAMDLLQTLLDKPNLSREYQSQLARTLARLAKLASCYPNSLILRDICRSGKDPVAGGGFADVWKGLFRERTVALKAFRIFKKKPQEKVFEKFSHEAVIWRQLKHPNILPFYGVFKGDEDFDRLCLVSPWMDAGNVMEYIDRHIDCNRITLLADVACGLEYLHSFKRAIIHGDLKGANIFINSFNVACIGDFGLTRFRDSEESSYSATTGNSVAGTLRWQAPELFSHVEGESSRVCQETDVYSFGCVFIEVMTGKIPFAEIRQDPAFVIAIMNKQKPQRPTEDLLERGLDDSLWVTIMQCWDADPCLRPSASQLVQYFDQRTDLDSRDSRNIGCSEFPEALRTSLGQYGFPDDFVAKVSGEHVLV